MAKEIKENVPSSAGLCLYKIHDLIDCTEWTISKNYERMMLEFESFHNSKNFKL